jgi:uncharacterized repeat protein (TIGR03803 family)
MQFNFETIHEPELVAPSPASQPNTHTKQDHTSSKVSHSAKLERTRMRKHVLGKFASTIAAFCVASAIGSPAQTFTSLSSFDGNDGGYPVASLIQGADGNLYGTTEGDGISDGGTVIKITPEGQISHTLQFLLSAELYRWRIATGGAGASGQR